MSAEGDEDRDEWELLISVVQNVINNLIVLMELEEVEAIGEKRKADESF